VHSGTRALRCAATARSSASHRRFAAPPPSYFHLLPLCRSCAQANCVKLLSVLSKLVSDPQVQEVAERLSQYIISGRDELR